MKTCALCELIFSGPVELFSQEVADVPAFGEVPKGQFCEHPCWSQMGPRPVFTLVFYNGLLHKRMAQEFKPYSHLQFSIFYSISHN